MWHWAFGGINQQDNTINHGQNALNLTAEIGVARRVDDVDAGVFPLNGGYFRQNGDPALALDVVGIHRPFSDALVITELAGLL